MCVLAGLLCDLLWSDPDTNITGWAENDRGVSYTFGADVVSKFLQKHDLDLICRAHQVVEDGYEFFAKRQLVTLFSAPNYCGEFDNAGAMMSVDETLMCSFQVTAPVIILAETCLLSFFFLWCRFSSQWRRSKSLCTEACKPVVPSHRLAARRRLALPVYPAHPLRARLWAA